MLRAIIVEYSKEHLENLNRLISAHPRLELISIYANAIEAKEGIKKSPADVIFLELNLQEISGLDLLDFIPENTQVVLISDKKEDAYHSFVYQTSGFLLKPINELMFNKTVERLIMYKEKIFVSDPNDPLQQTLVLKSNLVSRKVVVNSIKWVKAVGDYVKVTTDTENLIVLSTMKEFLDKLPQEYFMRIHKSFIVNLKRIEKYNSKEVELEGQKIPISRNRKEEFYEKFIY